MQGKFRAKLKGLVALVLIISIPFVAHSADDRKLARKLYKKGLNAFKAGNTEGALEKFRASAQADSTFPHPLLAIARIHHTAFESEMHYYQEASQAYEQLTNVLLMNPPSEKAINLYQGYLYKGLLYVKGGDYSKALVELDKFIELYPEYDQMHTVHNARGIAWYYLDQYEQAVVAFKQALDVNPAFAEARFNLRSVFTRVTAYNEANVLYRAGEPAKAYERLRKLRDIAPRFLAGRRLEAKILTDLGRPGEAVGVYREVLGFHPDAPETYWMRIDAARLLITLDKKIEARGLLMENLSIFPNVDDHRARLEVVMLLNKLGQEQ